MMGYDQSTPYFTNKDGHVPHPSHALPKRCTGVIRPGSSAQPTPYLCGEGGGVQGLASRRMVPPPLRKFLPETIPHIYIRTHRHT